MFGFCITHILNTECAKIWKKKSVAKRLICRQFSKSTGVNHLQGYSVDGSKFETWNSQIQRRGENQSTAISDPEGWSNP